MISKILIEQKYYEFRLDKPIDISIPLRAKKNQVKCFYADDFQISPVRTKAFVGSIEEGGLLNFMNVKLNPHGNGTHTECVSHIWPGSLTINQCLDKYFHLAQIITVIPTRKRNGDKCIGVMELKRKFYQKKGVKAVIIRSLPNENDKLTHNYSGTNPAYFTKKAMKYMVDQGIQHLLTDLPSVDKEKDGGALCAHKIFWGVPSQIRKDATITELIFVENKVGDGLYLLNLQIASFEMDASPSKPVVYKLDLLN